MNSIDELIEYISNEIKFFLEILEKETISTDFKSYFFGQRIAYGHFLVTLRALKTNMEKNNE